MAIDHSEPISRRDSNAVIENKLISFQTVHVIEILLGSLGTSTFK
jgi:hypothetical protein